MTARLSHLARLESEAIHILREAVADARKPVMLFSAGKDSTVLAHLALRAFYPGRPPFPLLHIDSTWEFQSLLDFRDGFAREHRFELIVHANEEGRAAGLNPFDHGDRYTLEMRTEPLKAALDQGGYDIIFGGARRDEEKSRAKERVFSFRDEFGQWDPKAQRPELWSLYNGRIRPGEHIRAFPISNWTELDVWQYIARENIELPSIYFAHRRLVVERDGMLFGLCEVIQQRSGEEAFEATVRYRTVGDMTCTAAVDSAAITIEEIIAEVAGTRITERGATRADDRFSEAAMEDRKKEGYF